ncbi:MAG TPA: ABC transporter permease [Anaerolineae bacterium]|nr:ABC transporter permease [Anaerolineae bacterium]
MSLLSQAQKIVRPGLRIQVRREVVLLIVLFLAMGTVSRLSDQFLTVRNFQIMAPYLVEVGLISIAMTMILIIKGIDISVGSMVGLCAVIMGFAWRDYGFGIWTAAAAAVALGTLCGLFNGLAISKVRVPDLIVTLATLAIYRGVAEGLSGGQPVTKFPESFLFLGQGRPWGVPTQLFILIPAVVIGGLALERTSFGRYLYAIGNNEMAARFCGVKVDRIRLFAYLLSGFLSGLASVIYVSRLNTARSNMGIGLEFEVITGVVLGGTSIAGGEGSIWGSILGLALIVILRNGLNLAGVPTQAQAVVIGAILIVTVLINENLRRR